MKLIIHNEPQDEYTITSSLKEALSIVDKGEGEVYFNKSITDWYTFETLAELGIQHLRITQPIAFDLQTLIKHKAKHPNLKVHVIANPANLISLQDFYIRPEDLSFYEKFFEYIEVSNQRAYQIYQKREWLGSLESLFPSNNLKSKTPNIFIPEHLFPLRRHSCKQNCITELSNCTFCQSFSKEIEI